MNHRASGGIGLFREHGPESEQCTRVSTAGTVFSHWASTEKVVTSGIRQFFFPQVDDEFHDLFSESLPPPANLSLNREIPPRTEQGVFSM